MSAQRRARRKRPLRSSTTPAIGEGTVALWRNCDTPRRADAASARQQPLWDEYLGHLRDDRARLVRVEGAKRGGADVPLAGDRERRRGHRLVVGRLPYADDVVGADRPIGLPDRDSHLLEVLPARLVTVDAASGRPDTLVSPAHKQDVGWHCPSFRRSGTILVSAGTKRKFRCRRQRPGLLPRCSQQDVRRDLTMHGPCRFPALPRQHEPGYAAERKRQDG